MSVDVVPYSADQAEEWDRFCVEAGNATFLHSRRFLSYHGERFTDASVMMRKDDRLVGVFPAAFVPGRSDVVSSHPGATFGGIVHQGWLSGHRMIEALAAMCTHYVEAGITKLIYKAVPHIYAAIPAQDDLYAFFRIGARRTRCDLSSAIDLEYRRQPSERRRRGAKKAWKSVNLSGDIALLPGLYGVIERNLASRHGARPVHTIEELALLQSRFPDKIIIRCAMIGGRAEAGVILFNSRRTWHAQYIASSEIGHETSALDAVFEAAVAEARETGARFFDFGTSNEESGTLLNESLYRYKTEFGGGGVAYEFYELDLVK